MPTVSRRAVALGTAWSVPTVLLTAPAPAFAASVACSTSRTSVLLREGVVLVDGRRVVRLVNLGDPDPEDADPGTGLVPPPGYEDGDRVLPAGAELQFAVIYFTDGGATAPAADTVVLDGVLNGGAGGALAEVGRQVVDARADDPATGVRRPARVFLLTAALTQPMAPGAVLTVSVLGPAPDVLGAQVAEGLVSSPVDSTPPDDPAPSPCPEWEVWVFSTMEECTPETASGDPAVNQVLLRYSTDESGTLQVENRGVDPDSTGGSGTGVLPAGTSFDLVYRIFPPMEGTEPPSDPATLVVAQGPATTQVVGESTTTVWNPLTGTNGPARDVVVRVTLTEDLLPGDALQLVRSGPAVSTVIFPRTPLEVPGAPDPTGGLCRPSVTRFRFDGGEGGGS